MIVVFVDLEVRIKTKKVFRIGAIKCEWNDLDSAINPVPIESIEEDKKFIVDNIDEANDYDDRIKEAFSGLKEFADGADYFCGHNIIAFDSRFIEEGMEPAYDEMIKSQIKNLSSGTIYKYIDTLTISPIIFPEYPVHKLDKDYKNPDSVDDEVEELNDPYRDSYNCRRLFGHEVERFLSMLKDNPILTNTLVKLIIKGDETERKIQLENFIDLLHSLDKSLDDNLITVKECEHLSGDLTEDVLSCFTDSSRGKMNVLKNKICITGIKKGYASSGKTETRVKLAYVLANIYANERICKNESGKQITYAIIPGYIRRNFTGIDPIIRDLRGIRCDDPDCKYCNRKTKAGKILPAERFDLKKNLQEFFGYPSFNTYDDGDHPGRKLALQEMAASRALEGGNLFSIFPTGGGKSLAFQLPALMQWRLYNALTVVISPLQSLMNDQVDNLEAEGLYAEAVTYNGSKRGIEKSQAINQVYNGSAAMIYISPESLNNDQIINMLRSRTIARFVLDEAHCFSGWGKDFRRDYRILPKHIRILMDEKGFKQIDNTIPPIPVSFFTATAENSVIEDLDEAFEELYKDLPDADKELYDFRRVTTTAQRSNLRYHLQLIGDVGERPEQISARQQYDAEVYKKKFKYLVNIIEKRLAYKEPGAELTGFNNMIIYTTRISTANKLTNDLNKHFGEKDKIQNETEYKNKYVRRFHGKLDRAQKVRTLNWFKEDVSEGQTRIIVATSAFGMGVDKKHVRTVIHFDISNTLEDYIQEAGRAGRDGEPADCYLIYCDTDTEKNDELRDYSELQIESIQSLWDYLKENKSKDDMVYTFQNRLNKAAGLEMNTELTNLAMHILEEKEFIDIQRDKSIPCPTLIKEPECDLSPLSDLIIRTIKSEIHDKGKSFDRTDFFNEILNDKEKRNKFSFRDVVEAWNSLVNDGYLLEGRQLRIEKSSRLANAGNDEIQSILLTLKKTELDMYDLLKEGKAYPNCVEVNEDLDCKYDPDCLKNIYNLWISQSFILRNPEGEISFAKYKFSPSHDANESETIDRDYLESRYEAAEKLLLFVLEKDRSYYELDELRSYSGTDDERIFRNALDMLNHYEILDVYDTGSAFIRRKQIKILRGEDEFSDSDYSELADHYAKNRCQSTILMKMVSIMDSDDSGSELQTFFKDYFTMNFTAFREKYDLLLNVNDQEERTDLISEIIDDNSETVCVNAGPGSGKTEMMTKVIRTLLKDKHADPADIIMVTFTRKAMEEFKDRLYKQIGPLASGITISTFHSYASRIIGRSGSIENELIEKASEKIKGAIKQIEEYDKEDKDLVFDIFNNMPVRKEVIRKYLIIDEAQDIDKPKYDLLKNLQKLNNVYPGNPDGLKIYAVGDNNQAIFEFIKVDRKDYLEELCKECKPHFLNINYRSNKELVNFTENYIGRAEEDRMISGREDNVMGKIHYIVCDNPKSALINRLLNDLHELRSSEKTPSIGILTYKKATTYEIEKTVKSKLILKENADIRITNFKRTNCDYFSLDQLDEFHAILKRMHEAADGRKEIEISAENNELDKILIDFENAYGNSIHCKKAIALTRRYSYELPGDELNIEEFTNYLSRISFERFNDLPIESFDVDPENDDSADTNAAQDIFISTIHSAKGSQFDRVYIFHDADTGYLKDHHEEYIKEMYVALTRARDEIYLFDYADYQPNNHLEAAIKEAKNHPDCFIEDMPVENHSTEDKDESDNPKIYIEQGLSDVILSYVKIGYIGKAEDDTNLYSVIKEYKAGNDSFVPYLCFQENDSNFFDDTPSLLQAGNITTGYMDAAGSEYDIECEEVAGCEDVAGCEEWSDKYKEEVKMVDWTLDPNKSRISAVVVVSVQNPGDRDINFTNDSKEKNRIIKETFEGQGRYVLKKVILINNCFVDNEISTKEYEKRLEDIITQNGPEIMSNLKLKPQDFS